MTPEPSRVLQAVTRSQHQLVGVVSGDLQTADGRCLAILRDGWQTIRCRPSLKRWAARHGLPCTHYCADQMDEFSHWLKTLKPDLLITCKAPLLPPSIFSLPRLGSVNIHYALLPAWRGGSPLLWQVINNVRTGGVTFHRIDAGIDTGPILSRIAVELPAGASERELDNLLDKPAAKSLPGVIDAVAAGARGNSSPIVISGGLQAPNVHLPSLIDFIDWNRWSIDRIWRVLRFMEYWAQDYDIPIGWQRLFRWRVGKIVSREDNKIITDWLIEPQGRRLLVQTRSGIIELQPALHLPAVIRGGMELTRSLGARLQPQR